jgi:hypothetical protein
VTPTCHWCGKRDSIALDGEGKPICASCSAPVGRVTPADTREGLTVAKILRAIDHGAETREDIAAALGVSIVERGTYLTLNRLLQWIRSTGQAEATPIDPGRKRPRYRYAPRRRAA